MKDKLRGIYASTRANFIDNGRKIADLAICENFIREFGDKNSYFIYNSFGSEADTSAILATLLDLGKRVYLPKTEGEKMFSVPYGEMKRGRFGILEPCGEPYFGKIDVTVTPLLAVDKNGYRLGYGGGYYDRFFKENSTFRVGLGYFFQLTDENFADEWDEPLNAFVSERGVIYFKDIK